jgi:hypothetical protein
MEVDGKLTGEVDGGSGGMCDEGKGVSLSFGGLLSGCNFAEKFEGNDFG